MRHGLSLIHISVRRAFFYRLNVIRSFTLGFASDACQLFFIPQPVSYTHLPQPGKVAALEGDAFRLTGQLIIVRIEIHPAVLEVIDGKGLTFLPYQRL